MPVLFHTDNLLAGAQAHSHFAIDASGMLRGRLQILATAAHLKQVAEPGLELLGGRSRAERSVVKSGRTADVRGHLAARKRIVENNLDIGRKAEPQQIRI